MWTSNDITRGPIRVSVANRSYSSIRSEPGMLTHPLVLLWYCCNWNDNRCTNANAVSVDSIAHPTEIDKKSSEGEAHNLLTWDSTKWNAECAMRKMLSSLPLCKPITWNRSFQSVAILLLVHIIVYMNCFIQTLRCHRWKLEATLT